MVNGLRLPADDADGARKADGAQLVPGPGVNGVPAALHDRPASPPAVPRPPHRAGRQLPGDPPDPPARRVSHRDRHPRPPGERDGHVQAPASAPHDSYPALGEPEEAERLVHDEAPPHAALVTALLFTRAHDPTPSPLPHGRAVEPPRDRPAADEPAIPPADPPVGPHEAQIDPRGADDLR